MHDELFQRPTAVSRYRTGPYAEARESFLRQARAKGYAPLTLERMARALLIAAHATHRNGGQISSEHLKATLTNCMRRQPGSPPYARTVKWFLHCGKAWLQAIGALLPAAQQPARFDREQRAFAENMAAERGLSPATIRGRQHMLRWFFASLPPRVQAIEEITLSHIECFLRTEAKRGWSRRSLHTLGSTLRTFFRFAACQGWCQSHLAFGIDLPRLYDLEDVPRAPASDEVDRLLEAAAAGSGASAIRDHAILLLLTHYGLRRGEVERLTLDDLDWKAEAIRITRQKVRKPQTYPLSVAVGTAVLRYLREVRPRCSHRACSSLLRRRFARCPATASA